MCNCWVVEPNISDIYMFSHQCSYLVSTLLGKNLLKLKPDQTLWGILEPEQETELFSSGFMQVHG